MPLACLGGVLALVVTGTPFSVSAAVGFISIFAIAIMDGILLNFYIHQLWREGHSVVDSIVMGADRRFRALMMTALVDGLGLLPAALSTRIGAQTQRPLAIVVIGGAISIALLTRVFHPTLVYLLRRPLGLVDEGRASTDSNQLRVNFRRLPNSQSRRGDYRCRSSDRSKCRRSRTPAVRNPVRPRN